MKNFSFVLYTTLSILFVVSVTDVSAAPLTQEEIDKEVEKREPANWGAMTNKERLSWKQKIIKEIKEEHEKAEEEAKKKEAEEAAAKKDEKKPEDKNTADKTKSDASKSKESSAADGKTEDGDELEELKKCKCVKRYIELSTKHAYNSFSNHHWIAFLTESAAEKMQYFRRRIRKGRHRFDA
ncbi:MAG: hypothetical protein LBT70_05045 [Holosporaceae bacterium]|nr:hypothetical protein [Holosporaceae bacterium]